MEDPLALENRRRIFQYIEGHPGTHMREMERELNLSIGVMTYHLMQLERSSLIKTFDDGYTKKYFRADSFNPSQRKAISQLGSRQSRRIVLLLLETDQVRFKDMASRLEVSKSTLSHHMKRLIRGQVVETLPMEGEIAYKLVDREAALACMAIVMGRSDVINSFAQIWDDLNKAGK